MSAEADAFLIESVARGDPRAWQEVIDRYQGRLLSFARRMLAARDEAEDLVQETFMGLLRSLPNYDRSRSLETYLFAILRNKLHDHFRRAPRGQRQSLDHLDLDEARPEWLTEETPTTQMSTEESRRAQQRAIAECLRKFAEQCQQQRRFQELMVVEMLVVLGMRNKEVAADTGMTETAVAGVKFRVIERWRQLAASLPYATEWQETDLAYDSSVGRIWREEGVSCLKRSTLGKYMLGVLDDEWREYVDFHVGTVGCDRCNANLEDLKTEDERDEAARSAFRERCFASSVGFLSRRPT